MPLVWQANGDGSVFRSFRARHQSIRESSQKVWLIGHESYPFKIGPNWAIPQLQTIGRTAGVAPAICPGIRTGRGEVEATGRPADIHKLDRCINLVCAAFVRLFFRCKFSADHPTREVWLIGL